jgi:ABC-type branched-subunit amino acid transport system ATPase component
MNSAELSNDAFALLVVSGIDKLFGGLKALDGCSFTVAEATVTGVIGPNGAGKSTMIDVISGFGKPFRGTVQFAGREIQHLTPHQISRLGVVRTFQVAREWPHLTVMENLLAAAPRWEQESAWRALVRRNDLRDQTAADCAAGRQLLREWGLQHLENEYAGNLSGGQKRLLEFGRILMARPRLALLDEPLAGVHPRLSASICEAIEMLRGEGITVLIVEHNLSVIETVCTSVLAMAEGRPIARGSMAELRGNSAVIDAYLGDMPSNA